MFSQFYSVSAAPFFLAPPCSARDRRVIADPRNLRVFGAVWDEPEYPAACWFGYSRDFQTWQFHSSQLADQHPPWNPRLITERLQQ